MECRLIGVILLSKPALINRTHANKFHRNLKQNKEVFTQGNEFENVACKCVNWTWPLIWALLHKFVSMWIIAFCGGLLSQLHKVLSTYSNSHIQFFQPKRISRNYNWGCNPWQCWLFAMTFHSEEAMGFMWKASNTFEFWQRYFWILKQNIYLNVQSSVWIDFTNRDWLNPFSGMYIFAVCWTVIANIFSVVRSLFFNCYIYFSKPKISFDMI